MKAIRIFPLVVSIGMLLVLAACTGIPTLLAATPASPQSQWSQVTTPSALERQPDIITPQTRSSIPKQDPTVESSNGAGNVSQPPVDVTTPYLLQTQAYTPTPTLTDQNSSGLPQTGANVVQVTLTEYGILMPAALPSGLTQMKVTNAGITPYRLVLEGQEVSVELETLLEPGKSSTLEVDLSPGPYTLYTVDGEGSAQEVRLNIVVTSPAGPGPTATEGSSQALTPTAVTTVIGTTTVQPGGTPEAGEVPVTLQPTLVPETLGPAPTNQPTPLLPDDGTAIATHQATPAPEGTASPTSQPDATPEAQPTAELPQIVVVPGGEKTYLPLTGSDLTGQPSGSPAGQTAIGPNPVFLPFTGADIGPASSQAPVTSTVETGTANLPAAVEVDLSASGGQFNLDEIEVPAGAPVAIRFTNNDTLPHNFSVYREGEVLETVFIGPIVLPAQASTIYKFNAPSEPGTYYFRCDSHPFSMVGRIEVR